MQKPWSLYNKEDKLRVDDLTPDQVRVVLLATASSRMDHWYACQEGDVHWQAIRDIPEFYEDVRQIKGPKSEEDRDKEITAVTKTSTQASPPTPVVPPIAPSVQRRPLFEDAPMEATEPTLQVERTTTKERRTARRYERRLDFKIVGEAKQFQTRTTDISMAGIALEQALPDWVQKNFVAELSKGPHVIKVLCAKVGPKKMKLKDSNSWDVIRAWIVNW